MEPASIMIVNTTPFPDQQPGTSGLRKRVTTFQQPKYIENFIQSILNVEPMPSFLVIGGDGRYYNDQAIKRVVSVCVANSLCKLIIAKDGILSTPAGSSLIRATGAEGGIILTASHNPGGPNGDLGIKYNLMNGGPAPEHFTNRVYDKTREITFYRCLLREPELDLSTVGTTAIGLTEIEVVDPVENYVFLMKNIFDMGMIKELFTGSRDMKPLKISIDCMNGVMGPYAKKIFVDELGAPEDSIINGTPLPDFGGKHPDPNLTYASDLVSRLKADPEIEMGVAFDGDGDRHMILGKEGFFVTPGDSLAVVAANLKRVNYYMHYGFRGFARSFPTSPAIDRVAVHFGLPCHVTPTGWKYFGDLLDGNLITVCGEESFGAGADHIREKDGLFIVLIWLNVMAHYSRTVVEIMTEHWRQFGRDYFCRYDFEDCDIVPCTNMMNYLDNLLNSRCLIGRKFGQDDRYEICDTGNFQYRDPYDPRKITFNQGLYIKCLNEGKIVFRLSGTGSCGATVRLYVTDFSRTDLESDPRDVLRDLLKFALEISKLPEYTGRSTPTVIT